MKKSLLLLTFACFLFAGSQSSFAQSQLEKQKMDIKSADKSVKENAEKVINLLQREGKLDNSQKNNIYSIFANADKKIKGIEAIDDAAEQKTKKAKMQTYIDQKLKEVLTPKQYELYTKKMKGE